MLAEDAEIIIHGSAIMITRSSANLKKHYFLISLNSSSLKYPDGIVPCFMKST